jgi:hypothetical protein
LYQANATGRTFGGFLQHAVWQSTFRWPYTDQKSNVQRKSPVPLKGVAVAGAGYAGVKVAKNTGLIDKILELF